jgi:hypothetical protein
MVVEADLAEAEMADRRSSEAAHRAHEATAEAEAWQDHEAAQARPVEVDQAAADDDAMVDA